MDFAIGVVVKEGWGGVEVAIVRYQTSKAESQNPEKLLGVKSLLCRCRGCHSV